MTADDVGKMTVVALREALSARGLATDGLKAALAERLRESVDAEGTRGTKRKENATTGVDGAEGETGKRATKRRRWDEDPAEANATATEGKSEASATKDAAAAVKAKAKAALDKAALLKQKEALLKQKELAAKLKAKKLGDAAKGKAAAPPPPVKKPSARPMALRLDAQGREIDENGELVKTKVIETSTLRMNLKQQRADAFAQAQAEAQAELAAQASEYDDPRMGKFAGRSRKPRSTLQVRVRFLFLLFYTFSPLRENCASFKAPWLSHDMRHGDYKNAKLKGLRSNTHREHFTRA